MYVSVVKLEILTWESVGRLPRVAIRGTAVRGTSASAFPN